MFRKKRSHSQNKELPQFLPGESVPTLCRSEKERDSTLYVLLTPYAAEQTIGRHETGA